MLKPTIISKFLALAYFVALVAIVVLADRGELDRYISFYRRIPFGDAIGHFVLIGTFAFFMNLVFNVRTFRFRGRRILVGSLVAFILVFLEECSQLFFQHRTFSLVDLFADVAGILFFGWLAQAGTGRA